MFHYNPIKLVCLICKLCTITITCYLLLNTCYLLPNTYLYNCGE